MYQDMLKKMRDYDSTLTCHHFDLNQCVYVQHEDGTSLRFMSAFARIVKSTDTTYLMVFTEHSGCHLFDIDDLVTYDSYKIEYLEIKNMAL